MKGISNILSALCLAALPAVVRAQSTLYPINYDEDTEISNSRYTYSIGLTSADGTQTAAVDQQSTKKLYIKCLDNCFWAKPGEKVTPTVGFNGTWMAGYAYIDKGNDGKFDVTYTSEKVTEMGDLMSYSLYNYYDSDGNSVTLSSSPAINPPAFTIPSDLTPGIYRMRYKVDWDNVDPGGNNGTTNKITTNGGVIVDTRINVHRTTASLTSTTAEHGTIALADGSTITDLTVPFGTAVKIKVTPESGYNFSKVVVRHGYNLDGDQLVNENQQWAEDIVDVYSSSDDEYTIPASMIDGDVRLTPYFSTELPTPTVPSTGNLDIVAIGGNVVGSGNSGVPATITTKQALTLLPLAPADGYVLKSVTVRHGMKLDNDQYVGSICLWNEYTVDGAKAGEEFTIPADCVDGDVRVTAVFEADGTESYELAFADEFNTADGTQPDATYWSRCSRENSTWKRFTAQTTEGQEKTGYIKDGKLVMRCVANDISDEGSVDMISGAIESKGKFYYSYGRIEGRLKTTPHTGNFPAFWLMPQDNSAGWPNAGEIDLWEQIDSENKTYHTVHTHCTYDLQTALPNSGSTSGKADEWHIIALDWTPTTLTWYVDGKQAFTYSKSTDEDLLSKGQWPYDKPFYIILNQSVGNGSWADNCDTSFDYETLFDYVRVYREKIDVNITDAKYATTCLPWNGNVPEGVTPYIATKYNESQNSVSSVHIEKYNGNVLPAGVGFLLYSDNEGKYSFSRNTTDTPEIPEGNFLLGTSEKIDTSSLDFTLYDYMLLGNKSQGVGFYRLESGSHIPAYRAYIKRLVEDNTAESKQYVGFDFGAETAIKAIGNDSKATLKRVYGINGVQRSKLQDGINLMKMTDGSVRKVLVK